MGTYSQPSRVLDTSFSNVGKEISDATALAIKNMNAANKKAIADKQKLEKEKKRLELEEKKRQAKIGGEETKKLADIEKELGKQENLRLNPNVNKDSIAWSATDGTLYKTATSDYNKYIDIYKKNKAAYDDGTISDPTVYLPVIDEIQAANLDVAKYEEIVAGGLPTDLGGDEVVDEVGINMEDQLVNGVKFLYSGLRDINPYSDDYEKQKQLINTFSQEGIEMVALINQTTQMINPYQPDSPFDQQGNLLDPERGVAGRYLFSDDPQANVILNFSKDYAFGINEGRFKLEMDPSTKKPVVLYNHDGKEYKLTKDDLQKAVQRTGQGVLGVTSQDQYNETMKTKYQAAAGGSASGDYQAVDFKGTIDTYRTTSTDPETGKRVTVTKKVRKIDEEKAKLYQFSVNDIRTNGTNQNMWQMMGGPGMTINDAGEFERMSKPVRSQFQSEDRYKRAVQKYNSTFVWKGTPEQYEIAAEMQYRNMEKKLLEDNPGAVISSREQNQASAELVKEYKDKGVFNFKNPKLAKYIDGGKGVIRTNANGEYDLGLEIVYQNYENLTDNNNEGAVEFLNEYYKGYGGTANFKSGAQLRAANQSATNQSGGSATIQDNTIYELSGGKWYPRTNLSTKRGLFSKLQRSPGISTNVNKSAYYKTLDDLQDEYGQLRQEEDTEQFNAMETANLFA